MDFFEIQIHLIEKLSENKGAIETIHDFLLHFRTSENDSIIQELLNLNFASDIISIETFISNAIISEPPKIKVKGYWFGIFETEDENKVSFQAYLAGSNKASVADETAEWAVEPKYFPENRYIKSDILEVLPSILKDDDLDLSLKYFPLWYLTIVIANYCKKNYKLLSNANKCLVAVGFDEGDFINIGSLNEAGFDLTKFKIKKPKPLKKTKTMHKYYAIDKNWTNAWSLTVLNEGYTLDFSTKYFAEATTGINKHPVDYSEAITYRRIISKKLLDILLPFNNNNFEYLPIEIKGHEDCQYYLLNVIAINNCLNEKETIWYFERYAKDIAFFEEKIISKSIFKLTSKDIQNYIYINAEIKEALESNGITGITLIPIRTF